MCSQLNQKQHLLNEVSQKSQDKGHKVELESNDLL